MSICFTVAPHVAVIQFTHVDTLCDESRLNPKTHTVPFIVRGFAVCDDPERRMFILHEGQCHPDYSYLIVNSLPLMTFLINTPILAVIYKRRKYWRIQNIIAAGASITQFGSWAQLMNCFTPVSGVTACEYCTYYTSKPSELPCSICMHLVRTPEERSDAIVALSDLQDQIQRFFDRDWLIMSTLSGGISPDLDIPNPDYLKELVKFLEMARTSCLPRDLVLDGINCIVKRIEGESREVEDSVQVRVIEQVPETQQQGDQDNESSDRSH